MKQLLSALAICSLAACSGPDQPENDEALDPVATDELQEASQAVSQAPGSEERADTAGQVTDRLPDAFHGRWGLVPADCTSTLGDAKGLLTIAPTRLEFYESVGTLDDISELGDRRVRADFAMTGEGMSWEREMVLEVEEDGQVLIRRDHGQDAAPEPLRYTRCE